MLVDEEVIFTTVQVEVAAVALVAEEYLFAVGHVASYAHVPHLAERETQHAQLL